MIQIFKGDSCNTLILSFPNHVGTHIDLPCHFDPNGKSLSDFAPDFWEFQHVEIVDISEKISESDLIVPNDLKDINNLETDFLINNLMGVTKINKTIVVAGGILGKENSVVVDNIKNPNYILGIADGSGKFKKEISMLNKKDIKTVHNLIND